MNLWPWGNCYGDHILAEHGCFDASTIQILCDGSYTEWHSSYTAGFLQAKLPRFFKGRGLGMCVHNSIQGM